jgi:hypothetical protein
MRVRAPKRIRWTAIRPAPRYRKRHSAEHTDIEQPFGGVQMSDSEYPTKRGTDLYVREGQPGV